MQKDTRSFRLTAVVTASSLVVAQGLSLPAFAQDAPAPPSQVGVPDQQTGDPPARVGRLARTSGTVSFHTQDQDQWSPAVTNYPVTTGNSFWTQPNAQAVIEVSASRIVMAPATELNIATLDDATLQATTPQGEVYMQLLPSGQRENYALQTPRGLVTLTVPGRYGILAGDTENPTLVTVIEGAAHIEGPGVSLDVGPEQTASITGNDAFQGAIGPAQRDAFLTAVLSNTRPASAPASVVAAMPGAADLAQYGSWAQSQEYGQVWYPQVASGWAPYRDGNWAYVEPWGWTWVDSEPWGFAPFHYGRWIDIGGRWAWVPGGTVSAPAPPVYAPALVTFLGIGAAIGVGVGIGAALSEGRIGWCPLGPREPYHPWYRASDRYFRQVNIRHVTNVTTINRNVTINNFVNRGAATVVPAAVMTASRPVASSVQRLDPGQFSQVRPVVSQQPLRPTPSTLGVTPAVARQLNLPPAATYGQKIAPGPAIRAAPVLPAGAVPGAIVKHPGLPALHNPTQAAIAPATQTRPLSAAPALRNPPAPGQIATPVVPQVPHAAGVAPATITHTPPPAANAASGTTLGSIPRTMPQGIVPPAAPVPPVVNRPPVPELRGGPATAAHPALPPANMPPAALGHPPPPDLHASSPMVHTPPAMVHAAPPPPPQVHAPPPPPAQNAQHKRPGEP